MGASTAIKKNEGSCTTCCTKFQNGVNTVGKKMLEGDSINKTAKLGVAAISLVKALYPLHEAWSNLSVALKGCITWLDTFEIVNRVREWLGGEVKGVWKILSRICLTAFQTINIMKFLDYLKFIDMKSITETLGRIPVIGFIVGLPSLILGLGAYMFSLVHNSTKASENSLKAALANAKKEACESKKSVIEELKDKGYDKFMVDPSYDTLYKKYLVSKEKVNAAKISLGQKVKDATDQNIKIRWDQIFINSEDRTATSGLKLDVVDAELVNLKGRINHHKAQAHNGSLEKSKAIVSIVSDATKAIFFACGLIGIFTEISLLAFASLPMLIMGTIAAATGVFKVFYDLRTKVEVPKLPKKPEPEAEPA
jgi:hypothetical protein